MEESFENLRAPALELAIDESFRTEIINATSDIMEFIRVNQLGFSPQEIANISKITRLHTRLLNGVITKRQKECLRLIIPLVSNILNSKTRVINEVVNKFNAHINYLNERLQPMIRFLAARPADYIFFQIENDGSYEIMVFDSTMRALNGYYIQISTMIFEFQRKVNIQIMELNDIQMNIDDETDGESSD